MRDSFSADPTVVFLTSVLEDIAHGRIRIPRFQRPLVWKWPQRREFLESIFAGLPIGSLMIWATSNSEVGCYDSLGPHLLPSMSISSETRYLMDGVQRVSTLYGALRATQNWTDFDEEHESDLRDFVVYADLDADDDFDRFKRAVDIAPGAREADPTRYLPLSIILQSRELLRFQRELAEGNEQRIDRADEVASAFRQYKVPIITLNSASLEVVTKSFERINSRGADMSELHMLNALTYSPQFDLLKRDQELRNEMLTPFGWHEIDSEIVLRCLKLNLGVDIYKTNPDEISKTLRQKPLVLDQTFRGLRETADFFREAFSLKSSSLVPYRLQIVAISTALVNRFNGNYFDSIKDWVWLSSYAELFGGAGRQSEGAIEDLRSFIDNGNFKWTLREPPAVRNTAEVRSDFRAARVKALMLALVDKADAVTSSFGKELILSFGGDAFQSLSLKGVARGDQGARFLIEPKQAGDFKQRLLMGSLDPDERERHIVSETAMQLLDAENMSFFTRQRAQDLFAYERNDIVVPAAKRLGITSLRILRENDAEVERRSDEIDE